MLFFSSALSASLRLRAACFNLKSSDRRRESRRPSSLSFVQHFVISFVHASYTRLLPGNFVTYAAGSGTISTPTQFLAVPIALCVQNRVFGNRGGEARVIFMSRVLSYFRNQEVINTGPDSRIRKSENPPSSTRGAVNFQFFEYLYVSLSPVSSVASTRRR